MGLPETGAVPDWCQTSPSITNFEPCEPEKKNSPLIKTLVSRLTYQSQTGNLSSFGEAPFVSVPKYVFLIFFSFINQCMTTALKIGYTIKELLISVGELAQSRQK